MNVLEMKITHENDKEVFNFFKQLKIEDVQKKVVLPLRTSTYHYTEFNFITKNGIKLVFLYEKNKIVTDVHVIKEDDMLFLYVDEMHQECINHIWNQFVDYFNLRIRLLFINEENPWKWNTEFIY